MKRSYRWDTETNSLVEISKIEPVARVYVIPDIQPYFDENMGSKPVLVKSRRHKNELLRHLGLAIK